MRKTLLLLALCPFALPAQPVNLVPNPGFEEYRDIPCSPLGTNISDYLHSWKCASDGTSDFISDLAQPECYSYCLSDNGRNQGYQKPHGGHNMVFFYNYSNDNRDYREYVAVELKSPLVPGKKYNVEMFVSLTDYSGLATNSVGAAFFSGELNKRNGYAIEATPQVYASEIISDAEGWTKISGSFIAQEAYTYMVIGNFLPREEVKMINRREGGKDIPHCKINYCGYYVDDVKVVSSDLKVTGDTLVEIGATARLLASGSKTYTWADSAKPAVILGSGAALNIPMQHRRTFIVRGADGETGMITVNVKKPIILKELEGRKVKKGRAVNVTNDEITITVYDNNKIDGDSISLYYGDSCIVSNYSLTGKKKSFKIKIDKNHSKQLILYAVNQGSQPPNTAAIIIKDGRHKIDVVLSSDMKSCDAIILTYKEDP